jgi:hypothetical protein
MMFLKGLRSFTLRKVDSCTTQHAVTRARHDYTDSTPSALTHAPEPVARHLPAWIPNNHHPYPTPAPPLPSPSVPARRFVRRLTACPHGQRRPPGRRFPAPTLPRSLVITPVILRNIYSHIWLKIIISNHADSWKKVAAERAAAACSAASGHVGSTCRATCTETVIWSAPHRGCHNLLGQWEQRRELNKLLEERHRWHCWQLGQQL